MSERVQYLRLAGSDLVSIPSVQIVRAEAIGKLRFTAFAAATQQRPPTDTSRGAD